MGAQEQVGRSVGIAVAAPLGVGGLSSADPARWEQVCRGDCRASLDGRGGGRFQEAEPHLVMN